PAALADSASGLMNATRVRRRVTYMPRILPPAPSLATGARRTAVPTTTRPAARGRGTGGTRAPASAAVTDSPTAGTGPALATGPARRLAPAAVARPAGITGPARPARLTRPDRPFSVIGPPAAARTARFHRAALRHVDTTYRAITPAQGSVTANGRTICREVPPHDIRSAFGRDAPHDGPAAALGHNPSHDSRRCFGLGPRRCRDVSAGHRGLCDRL